MMASQLSSAFQNTAFSEYLGSNAYISDENKRCQMRQLISQQDGEIATLDDTISRLKLTLEMHQHDRDDMDEIRQQHMDLLSASRSFPPEIWQKIFEECRPADEFVRIDTREAPMLLAQVCQSWRAVALSTPSLWNSIYITLSGSNTGAAATQKAQLIQLWLSRSGALPLSIKIMPSAEQPVGAFMEADSLPQITALLPFASRWTNLSVNIPQTLLETLVCNPNISLPNLTALSLRSPSELTVDRPLHIHSSAVALRTIKLSLSDMLPSLLHLPWHQLTQLHSDFCPDPEDAFNVFRLCPNLTHLALRNLHEVEANAVSHPVYPLRQLRWLQLASHGDVELLFDKIFVPSLLEFIWEPVFRDDFPRSHLISVTQRSLSPLETISIQETFSSSLNIWNDDINQCFTAINSLQRFAIWTGYGNEASTMVYLRGGRTESHEGHLEVGIEPGLTGDYEN